MWVLAYFTQYDNPYVHTCCCKCIIFAFYYSWAFDCVFDGHLGSSMTQAIVNVLWMIVIHVSFQIMASKFLFTSGLCHTFIFALWEIGLFTATVAVPTWIPKSVGGSSFPHPFQHLLLQTNKMAILMTPFWYSISWLPHLPSNPYDE